MVEKELNNISRVGKWDKSARDIDENFMIFEDDLKTIEYDIQKCKGLFPSLDELRREHPYPAEGSWAYVGLTLPAPIYVFRSGAWIDTGKIGGGNLDPRKFANSEPLEDGSDLFDTRVKWIQNNDGKIWRDVISNKIILINDYDYAEYIIRLSSLVFADEGELLEKTTTDAYLYKFNRGSFVSMSLTSSDGVTRDYVGGDLSWTVDNTFFKMYVSGVAYDRPPVEGDEVRATFRFKSPRNNDIQVIIINFIFTN